jgi:dipeptidyl aminopeptidase/acylaminoacyl peptidase
VVPSTPSSSDAPLSSPPIPIALTQSHAASSVQPLPNGRVVFTKSSLASPNDVFLLSGLDTREKPLQVEQITRFTEKDLKGKNLDEGEDFWFEGADGKNVHGWILKPKGFKETSEAARKKKKWPVVFMIHGGPQGQPDPGEESGRTDPSSNAGAWEDSWSTRWNPNSEYHSHRAKRLVLMHVVQFSRNKATS